MSINNIYKNEKLFFNLIYQRKKKKILEEKIKIL